MGLVAGLFVARALFASTGERMAEVVGTSVTFAQILSFFLIWLLVPVLLSMMTSLITRVIEAVHLGIVNRLLGACLGFVKLVLFVSLVIHFIEFADSEDILINETTKHCSLLYYPLAEFSDIFCPILRKATQNFIETTDL